MEKVGRRYDPDAFDSESLRTVDNSTIGPTRASSLRSLGRVVDEVEEVKKESCAASQDTSAADTTNPPSGPRYFYGFAGEKIGQACVSWLCRWGVDILPIEEEMAQAARDADVTTSSTPGGKIKGKDPSLVGRMCGISLSDSGSKKQPRYSHSASWTPGSKSSATESTGTPALRIWARGGLPAEWVRIVISSDAFWVRNEMERYEFAKRVVRLRLGDSVEDESGDAEEEEELALIFEKGIYYSHMVGPTLRANDILLILRRRLSNFRSFPPTSTPQEASRTFPSAFSNPHSGHQRITKAKLPHTDRTDHRVPRGKPMCPRME